MVEEGKYRIDILTQVSAASGALQGVAELLLERHIECCLLDAARAGGAERENKLKEASVVIGRLDPLLEAPAPRHLIFSERLHQAQ